MTTRRIGSGERRARLGLRHRLAHEARTDSVPELTDSLVALHSTDPASVYLSALARMREPTTEPITRALYDERSLVRLLGMRRTVFVTSVEVAGLVQAGCTRVIAQRQRTLLEQHLEAAGVAPDCASWLVAVEAETEAALVARGHATAAQLVEDVPLLRTTLSLAEGKAYAAAPNVTSRVLLLLAADGRIMRGRPRGSWISSQYHWWPLREWLPGGLADWPQEAAQVELARRWLARFGPATVEDLKWWTGWPMGQTRKALAQLAAVEVDLDGVPGVALPDDLEPVAAPDPWVALLPALDPTAMGWVVRDWYLGPYAPRLFDRTGNICPTVWSDGRVVGGWAHRKDGEVVFRLFEDLGAEATAAVGTAAERLATAIDPVRVTPRFRTPLDRELGG